MPIKFQHDVYFHHADPETQRLLQLLFDRLSTGMETLMSAISDFADKVKAHQDKIDAAVDGLVQDVKTLNDKITELQNTPGPITPSDQALLDDIDARATAAADKLSALDSLTPPPAPPTSPVLP